MDYCGFVNPSDVEPVTIHEDVYHCHDWDPPKGRLPGEPCTDTEDCLSHNCHDVTFICKGLTKHGKCEGHNDCDIHFTCHNLTCQSIVPNGHECDEDWDCWPASECNFGLCVEKFSLTEGEKVEHSAELCDTGYAANGVCTTPLPAKSEADEPCTSDTDCGALSKCLCGMNPDGLKYCSATEADPEYKALIEATREINKINKHCARPIAYSGKCNALQLSPAMSVYRSARNNYFNRHLLIGAPDCVYQVLEPWTVKYHLPTNENVTESIEEWKISIIALFASIFVLILAFIVCEFIVARFTKEYQEVETSFDEPSKSDYKVADSRARSGGIEGVLEEDDLHDSIASEHSNPNTNRIR